VHEEKGTGEPIYLELADALQLYAAIIGGTLAQAGDQLRDQSALEGALGRPRSYANYEGADIALQAAVLAHGIAESQAFIDANEALGARRDAEPTTEPTIEWRDTTATQTEAKDGGRNDHPVL